MRNTAPLLTAVILLSGGMVIFAADKTPDSASNSTGYIVEAALPVGWPAPAMPGSITDVRIPAHRAAEGPGFQPLFAHISLGGIPMTAPVVMPVADEQGVTPKKMQFLYPSATSEPGPLAPGITIVDVAEQRVLRVTVRGPVSATLMREKIALLKAEAETRQLTVCGEPTLCGYNGPAVKASERTSDICLPVSDMKK